MECKGVGLGLGLGFGLENKERSKEDQDTTKPLMVNLDITLHHSTSSLLHWISILCDVVTLA